MDRILDTQTVEGEISITIDYKSGESLAVDVLQGAMDLIHSLDRLDKVLLSSVDTVLEPVSILNDVQHSSLKMMLARALKKVPDEHLKSLDWKKWVGSLLVTGKYKLLSKLEASPEELQKTIQDLAIEYNKSPTLIGYSAPSTADVKEALDGVSQARAKFPSQRVVIETELGDIVLPETSIRELPTVVIELSHTQVNRGTEIFKVRNPDMLGTAQWTVLRDQRSVKVFMLDQSWLQDYQERRVTLLPQDGLLCNFEEKIEYDQFSNELGRNISIIKVEKIIPPPSQNKLPI